MAENSTNLFLEILQSYDAVPVIIAFCVSVAVGLVLGAVVYVLLTWMSRRRAGSAIITRRFPRKSRSSPRARPNFKRNNSYDRRTNNNLLGASFSFQRQSSSPDRIDPLGRMSGATLRLIRCRKLCTSSKQTGSFNLFQKRNLKKVAKVTGAVVLGGCLFITYEVAALDKALTIDTSAIIKEKYKSYIYLKGASLDEKENFASDLTQKARKELHKAARRFLEVSSWLFQHSLDEHFCHVDADPHEVALWVLLKKTKSANQAVRLEAVQELGKNHNWHDYQYQTAAQVIDQRTAVGLARTPQVDLRFFRPPPALLNQEKLET
uniref:HEAT repeat domain-containing protein n=1 Tax=Knipowitschia caucasica TaxID=637954 RepID=A0AAV2KCH4_KNICA